MNGWPMVLLCLVLIGCVPPVVPNTMSGRPEITTNAPLDRIKPELVSAMMNRGYSMRSDSGMVMVTEKRLPDAAGISYGGRYDPIPSGRITFTFLQASAQIRLIADMAIVTNPGSAYESQKSANHTQDARVIQQFLEDLKTRIELK